MRNVCVRTFVCALVLCLAAPVATLAITAADLENATRMPGTQPGDVTIYGLDGVADNCIGCHIDNNNQGGLTEAQRKALPGNSWSGSMMAWATKDPIFWACLTVALQDSIWAAKKVHFDTNGDLTGYNLTNAEGAELADVCLRCHTPGGWLNGRSDSTNGANLVNADFDGVHCEFCHRLYDPAYETTTNTPQESLDFLGYWDEANGPLTTEASFTGSLDAAAGNKPSVLFSNAGQFFIGGSGDPLYATYTEAAGGQYYVDNIDMLNSPRVRGPFADIPVGIPGAAHSNFYSRFHKSKFFCATCHDVSNPAVVNLGLYTPAGVTDQSAGAVQLSEQYAGHRFSHVERTFSEYMLSSYADENGAPVNSPVQAALGIAKASMCQDCHMQDVTGVSTNDGDSMLRPTASTEHPNSGMPMHDLTGGNIWMPYILASTSSNAVNYDATNESLLLGNDGTLTMDVEFGQTTVQDQWPNLLDAVDRAKAQLQMAGSVTNALYVPGSGRLTFRVQNNTGHKLISGFLEGRRMWVNVKARDDQGAVIYEVNPYDAVERTINGYGGAGTVAPLGVNQVYDDTLVYECLAGSSLLAGQPDETKTFHFALADKRFKDNRIPPKGFDVTGAPERLAEPVWNGAADANYFTAAEYSGGYDRVALTLPTDAASVEITLYYQGTSREYVEFLQDEINADVTTLPTFDTLTTNDIYLANAGDAFFTNLTGWGDTIYNLWDHNHDAVEGLNPFAMANATALVSPVLTGPRSLLTQ